MPILPLIHIGIGKLYMICNVRYVEKHVAVFVKRESLIAGQALGFFLVSEGRMDETSDACALCKQNFGSQDEEL